LRICWRAVNVGASTLGSSNRAFGIVSVSLRSSARAAWVSASLPEDSVA
jgi:hypothetical protein